MFDSHVHAGPDVVDRKFDDTALLRLYEQAGFDGFVLKAHHESTVGRAAQLSAASRLSVIGGLVLNRSVGGFNASAVAAALGSGARVIWMPTEDAHTQETAGLPRLSDSFAQLGRQTLHLPGTGDLAELDQILRLVADHDAVLATGHLSAEESRRLVVHAQQLGVRRLLVTHPTYVVPAMSTDEIEYFVGRGAHIEITAYQLIQQGPEILPLLVRTMSIAGDRAVIASDVGQPGSPGPAEALDQLASALRASGADPGQVDAAMSSVPSALFL